jgi:hypothetical protein
VRHVPPAAEEANVELTIDGGLRFSAQQIALYESCPRRFFYTYILQVGGRRTMTAFMRMHEVVRAVFQSVIDAEPPIKSEEELDQRITNALAAHGLAHHGYVDDYKALAVAMIKYFLSTREGLTPEPRSALRLTFGEEHIIVSPDDVLMQPNGSHIFRRIRTGHHRLADDDDVIAAAFILAAQQAFPSATVEIIYLSDQTSQTLTLSERQLRNRRDKLDRFLKEIRHGCFPASPSVRTCPGCPSFFICGPTPVGALPRKFE